MPKARVKDIEIYYEVHGTGTPLVHIGGLAGDALAWAQQIEHLSKHFQVVCFDNRGTGRTSCRDMPYSTKLFAEDTVGLMDALGINRAHIYGISMGGCIVQEIASIMLEGCSASSSTARSPSSIASARELPRTL